MIATFLYTFKADGAVIDVWLLELFAFILKNWDICFYTKVCIQLFFGSDRLCRPVSSLPFSLAVYLYASIDLVPSFAAPRSLKLSFVLAFLTFLFRSSRYTMIFNAVYHCTLAFGGGCIVVTLLLLLLLVVVVEIIHRSVQG